jgi:hypothetical protein
MTYGHCKLSNSGACPRDLRYAVKAASDNKHELCLFVNSQVLWYVIRFFAAIFIFSAAFAG